MNHWVNSIQPHLFGQNSGGIFSTFSRSASFLFVGNETWRHEVRRFWRTVHSGFGLSKSDFSASWWSAFSWLTCSNFTKLGSRKKTPKKSNIFKKDVQENGWNIWNSNKSRKAFLAQLVPHITVGFLFSSVASRWVPPRHPPPPRCSTQRLLKELLRGLSPLGTTHTTHLPPLIPHHSSHTTHLPPLIPTPLVSHHISHTTHLTPLISHRLSQHHSSPTAHPTQLISHHSSPTAYPTPLISHRSSHTTHLTPLISHRLSQHHSSPTTYPTPLISHHSSPTAHPTPLISHHSSPTAYPTPLISHHSSPTAHPTPLISHRSSPTAYPTPLISHHSSPTHLTPLISHHSSPTHLTPLISHHSSPTAHPAPLISHHSSPTTYPTPLISHHSSPTAHPTPLISHRSSPTAYPTPLISHHSSPTAHPTPLISHHSSPTAHPTTLISHHSFYTTHLTALLSQPLILHHSAHTTHLTPLISHHSSHTAHITLLFPHATHLTLLISHTTYLTPRISQHSSLTPFISQHSSHSTHLTPLTSYHLAHTTNPSPLIPCPIPLISCHSSLTKRVLCRKTQNFTCGVSRSFYFAIFPAPCCAIARVCAMAVNLQQQQEEDLVALLLHMEPPLLVDPGQVPVHINFWWIWWNFQPTPPSWDTRAHFHGDFSAVDLAPNPDLAACQWHVEPPALPYDVDFAWDLFPLRGYSWSRFAVTHGQARWYQWGADGLTRFFTRHLAVIAHVVSESDSLESGWLSAFFCVSRDKNRWIEKSRKTL